MRWRVFEDVPLPRFHDDTPLLADAARKLASDLPGVRVLMYDPEEDSAFMPERQGLGSVVSATAADDHVLATVKIDTAELGADRIVQMIDAGELRFGLWGTCQIDSETNVIHSMRPTSVRLTARPWR